MRAIRKTLSRFISIVIIVALGVGFFAGLKAVSPNMKKAAVDFNAANPGSAVSVTVVEGGFNQAEWESQVTTLAASGSYNLIVSSNPSLPDIVKVVSAKFPSQKFLLLDGELSGNPNVYTLRYNQREQAYMAGYIAALVSQEMQARGQMTPGPGGGSAAGGQVAAVPAAGQPAIGQTAAGSAATGQTTTVSAVGQPAAGQTTPGQAAPSQTTLSPAARKLGLVAAQEYPVMNNIILPGFLEGARAVDPAFTVDFRVVGNWFDAAKAAELTAAMIRGGVQVLLPIAGGAGQGVVQAAFEAGAKIVWFDTNGYALRPGTVIGSAILRQDKAAYEKIKLFLDGKLPFGKAEIAGASGGYVDFVDDDPLYISSVSQTIREKQAALVARLRSGSLKLD